MLFASGDRHRGLLPAATSDYTQSRDALEVHLRILCEDATLTSFVIKALYFVHTVLGIINRIRAMIQLFGQEGFDISRSSSHARAADVNLLIHAYSDRSQTDSPFCINLNHLHQYQLQQNDRQFRMWLKQVMGETPSLTATLHGATCGNLLCTYQI